MAHDLWDEWEQVLPRLQAALPLSEVKPYFAYRREHLEHEWRWQPEPATSWDEGQIGLYGPYTIIFMRRRVLTVWFPTPWWEFLTESDVRSSMRELFGRFARVFGQSRWVYCGDTSDNTTDTLEETLAGLRELYGPPAPPSSRSM